MQLELRIYNRFRRFEVILPSLWLGYFYGAFRMVPYRTNQSLFNYINLQF